MAKQADLFQAETQWFHVFRAMIDTGELAKMDGSAVKVYLVVKAHTNFSTGRSFPGIDLIAEKAGLSISQVQRCIKQLESHGYITKERKGRINQYTLKEKVQIEDGQGRPQAVATWDYLPGSVQQAVADLKNVLITGDLAGAKVVHIERLQVNVTHLHDQATNFNVQDFHANVEKLKSTNPKMAQSLLRAYENAHKEEGDKAP